MLHPTANILGLLCLAIMVLAGCEITQDSHGVVAVTDKFNNGEIHLQPGDTLSVRLKTQGGTGYEWQVVHCDEVQLSPLGDASESLGDELAGGVMYQVFRFQAQHAGTSTLELHYRRSWEKQAPAKVYRITVHIGKHEHKQ